jgi:DNA-binding transcriptional regulator YhcF (GntR family)
VTSGDEPLRDPITRNHHISLRRQLAAGLEAAIRDGHLEDGARLPSTRDLARRLSLSRDTVGAAYRRLRTRGWVTGREGGRLVIADRPHGGGYAEPAEGGACEEEIGRQAIASALTRAFRAGVPRETALAQLAAALEETGAVPAPESGGTVLTPESDGTVPAPEDARLAPKSAVRVTLIEPRPGLRHALAAELEARLSVRVRSIPLPLRTIRGPTLVRRELLPRCTRLAGAMTSSPGRPFELIPLRLAGGTRERGLVRRSIPFGVVVLVSVSGTVRRYAVELAARDFRRGLSFVAVDAADALAVRRYVSVARIVLCDVASRALAPRELAGAREVRLVSDDDIAALRIYLGCGSRPGADRPVGAIPRPARNLNGSGGLRILDGPFRPS